MTTAFELGYRVNNAFVSLEDYCNAYLVPRLPPEKIPGCIQLVYSQAWCGYYAWNDPAVRALFHTDSLGRRFLVIEDYSLKVFLEYSESEPKCVLMEAVFI